MNEKDILINLDRYSVEKYCTRGTIRFNNGGKIICYTCEDKYRPKGEPKVDWETCVATGLYPITMRKGGGIYTRYLPKYPDYVRHGLPVITNKPELKLEDAYGRTFQFVIAGHIGNDIDDTQGCMLTGSTGTLQDNGWISGSVDGFKSYMGNLNKLIDENPEAEIYIKIRNLV